MECSKKPNWLRQLRLKGIVSTQALLALSSTRYAPWMTTGGCIGRINIKFRCFWKLLLWVSNWNVSWHVPLRPYLDTWSQVEIFKNQAIEATLQYCWTAFVGRWSLGMREDADGWSKLYQNSVYFMYLLDTVASRFLFQLRWFIGDWGSVFWNSQVKEYGCVVILMLA